MRQSVSISAAILALALLWPATATAQEPDAGWEKRVLFEPLQVPSLAPAEDEPTLFLPAFFRAPVPWLTMDDRYEVFIADMDIQAELQSMEKMLLNPYEGLSQELTTGIQTEIGPHGERVQTYHFGGGRFEFRASSGHGQSRLWGDGYDSWLGDSNRLPGD
jgi:hypothetical protein